MLRRMIFNGQQELVFFGHRDFLDVPAEQSVAQFLDERGNDNTV